MYSPSLICNCTSNPAVLGRRPPSATGKLCDRSLRCPGAAILGLWIGGVRVGIELLDAVRQLGKGYIAQCCMAFTPSLPYTPPRTPQRVCLSRTPHIHTTGPPPANFSQAIHTPHTPLARPSHTPLITLSRAPGAPHSHTLLAPLSHTFHTPQTPLAKVLYDVNNWVGKSSDRVTTDINEMLQDLPQP